MRVPLMTTPYTKRKLRAILSADVKGYSHLMSQDEASTIHTLIVYKEAMSNFIEQYKGRVVDAPGDNLLAEFRSVYNAVNCAAEIQRELAKRNEQLPDNRKMEFRIGINLGDVVEKEGRIYGDGINIAARIEGLAKAGSICISGSVYDQIKNKLGLEYEYMGERSVKNISEPVRVYRVISLPGAAAHQAVQAKKTTGKMWRKVTLSIAAIAIFGAVSIAGWKFYHHQTTKVEAASLDMMAFPLPDKPSIAVLPFVNMSDDPEQEYFSDGITEDLITDLSKISGLFIIASHSTFSYKGKSVKIRHVAEELGVRYVLEGSVRKAQDQVRINAQLINAITGHQLWAERYDGRLDDVFALQDRVTQRIIEALALKLTAAERERALRSETENILAYNALLKGLEHYRRFNHADLAQAVFYFKQAIELDPNYGRAHSALILAYQRAHDMDWGWTLSLGEIDIILRVRQHLQMAVKKPTSLVHQLISKTYIYQRLFQEAVAEAERALDLDPNDPSGNLAMAEALIYDARPEEAVAFVNKARRLDPHNPAPCLYLQGLARFVMGEVEEAAALIESALNYAPEAKRWAVPLAAAYGYLGREQEGRAALAKTGFALTTLRSRMYYFPFDQSPEVAQRFADGLSKTGVGGKPNEYYKIFDGARLTGQAIRSLVFGRKVAGPQGVIDRTKDGIATLQRDFFDSESGASWIEADMLCNQWQTHMRGLKECGPVFRNPEGTPDGLDEYIWITDYKFIPFSPVD